MPQRQVEATGLRAGLYVPNPTQPSCTVRIPWLRGGGVMSLSLAWSVAPPKCQNCQRSMRWHSKQHVVLSKRENDVNVFVCENCERYAAQLVGSG